MYTTFDRVKELSQKRGISLSKLEETLGLGKNSIYALKRNQPSAERLQEIADYFNVSIDYLLGHSTDSINSPLEIELLRVFRSLTVEQQYICIDQSKVLMKYHTKIKEQQKRHS